MNYPVSALIEVGWMEAAPGGAALRFGNGPVRDRSFIPQGGNDDTEVVTAWSNIVS